MPGDILYRFRFDDDSEDVVRVGTTAAMHLATAADYQPPAWAKLAHHQCPHCPLDAREQVWCPVALNIAYVFEQIRPGRSYTPVTLTVGTALRDYRAQTTLQRALSSLFGLVCALSDCPHTAPLNPMARSHLPLASDTETFVRALSMMLLRAHLLQQPGSQAVADLELLYRNLNQLNRSLAQRLASQSEGEPAANALVLLDVLARDVTFELADQLPSLREMFGIAPATPLSPDPAP